MVGTMVVAGKAARAFAVALPFGEAARRPSYVANWAGSCTDAAFGTSRLVDEKMFVRHHLPAEIFSQYV